MKITKKQLRRIIREEKQRFLQKKINEHNHKMSGKDLSDIIDAIDEIGNAISATDPELANDLDLQVQRLISVHDKLTRQPKPMGRGERTPTESESGVPDSQRVSVVNRRPDY